MKTIPKFFELFVKPRGKRHEHLRSWAVFTGQEAEEEQKRVETLREVTVYLSENPSAIKLTNGAEDNNTPLMYAMMQGDYELAKLFLESGDKPDAKNAEGISVLRFITVPTKRQWANMVQLLINKKIIPDADMLHQCVERGYLEGVLYCLMNGVDVNVKDREGKTALSIAVRQAYDDVRAARENQDLERADIEAVERIAEQARTMIEVLLRWGAQPDDSTRPFIGEDADAVSESNIVGKSPRLFN